MNAQLEIKIKLFSLCEEYVNDKIKIAQEAIDNVQRSANEETKSSSGDKYETGRSMMQLEIEKYSTQLSEGMNLKKALNQINCKKTYQSVHPGSLVCTNHGNFVIAVSAGKLSVEGIDYIAVSLSSPIGQALYNKNVNDEITFRDKIYIVNSII